MQNKKFQKKTKVGNMSSKRKVDVKIKFSSRKSTRKPATSEEMKNDESVTAKTKVKKKLERKVNGESKELKTKADTIRKRLRRSDPIYRIFENERNRLYKQRRRADPDFKRREQDRNTYLKRLQRQKQSSA